MGLINKIYTKRFLNAIRVISVIAIIILVSAMTITITKGEEYNNSKQLFTSFFGTIITDFFCIVCFLCLIIFPQKISIIAIMSFLYAFTILVDEPSNFMGTLMALLSYFTLDARYFFRKNRIPKTIIFITILFFALLLEINFVSIYFLEVCLKQLPFFLLYH